MVDGRAELCDCVFVSGYVLGFFGNLEVPPQVGTFGKTVCVDFSANVCVMVSSLLKPVQCFVKGSLPWTLERRLSFTSADPLQ